MSTTQKVDGRFTYPETVNPPRRGLCIAIPEDDNHVRAFFGALNELANAFCWEWAGDGAGVEVAAVWQEILYDAAIAWASGDDCMSTNCYDCTLDLISITNIFNTNITTVNTWYTQFIVAGGLSVNASLITTVPRKGQGHDTELEQLLCYTSFLFINGICDALLAAATDTPAIGFAAKVASALGAIENVLSDIASTSLPNGVNLVAVIPAVGAAIGRAVANWVVDKLTPLEVEFLSDTQARSEVACCLAQYVYDVSSNTRAWSGWQTGALATANCTSVTFSDLGESLRIYLRYLIAHDVYLYISFYKLLDDQTWLDEIDAVPECPCGDTWCYVWDFTSTDGSWTNAEYGSGDVGEWVDEVGWVGTYSDSDDSNVLHIQRSFAERFITKWTIYYQFDGSLSIPNWAKVYLFLDGVLQSTKQSGYVTSGVPTEMTIDFGGVSADKVLVQLYPGGGRGEDADVTMTAFQIEGTGTNPIGTDNCT